MWLRVRVRCCMWGPHCSPGAAPATAAAAVGGFQLSLLSHTSVAAATSVVCPPRRALWISRPLSEAVSCLRLAIVPAVPAPQVGAGAGLCAAQVLVVLSGGSCAAVW